MHAIVKPHHAGVHELTFLPQNLFSMNRTTGAISVTGTLDRETVQTAVLVVKVEDTKADTPGQTATGGGTYSLYCYPIQVVNGVTGVAQLVEGRTRDPKDRGLNPVRKTLSIFPSQKCCADSLSVCPIPCVYTHAQE